MAHAHADQEQAFYILEGTIEVEVGDETYQLGPGDCVLLPRNVFSQAPQCWRQAAEVSLYQRDARQWDAAGKQGLMG